MTARERKDEDGQPDWTDVTPDIDAPIGPECIACGSDYIAPIAGSELMRCHECGEIFDELDGEGGWDAYGRHRTRLRDSDQ